MTYFDVLPKELKTELQYYQNYLLSCKINDFSQRYLTYSETLAHHLSIEMLPKGLRNNNT